ncbi:hypothetical protein O181_079801 [Austropuccinia psidii MF-1]|uniref:Uncharacterized protein n=1 Tax=Austropuccinia psidii MF-1 TaxID=1389203 RepID=A0A9Q3IEB7_9BASI|nr:hypothetical protein [Austropuccinia psidii MF-1]
MTSALPPDHLTPFQCLLSCMNRLLHHLLIIFSSIQDMLPLLPPHLHHNPSFHFHHPTSYNEHSPTGLFRFASTSEITSLQSPILIPLHPAPYHAYTPKVPYRYASDPATPCLPSPLLMLRHPQLILSAPYHA